MSRAVQRLKECLKLRFFEPKLQATAPLITKSLPHLILP